MISPSSLLVGLRTRSLGLVLALLPVVDLNSLSMSVEKETLLRLGVIELLRIADKSSGSVFSFGSCR